MALDSTFLPSSGNYPNEKTTIMITYTSSFHTPQNSSQLDNIMSSFQLQFTGSLSDNSLNEVKVTSLNPSDGSGTLSLFIDGIISPSSYSFTSDGTVSSVITTG
jgi:hypothetical protein